MHMIKFNDIWEQKLSPLLIVKGWKYRRGGEDIVGVKISSHTGTTRAVPDCSTNHSSADRIVVNSYNEDVAGAEPTGDTPTASEWSTILLHTKVWLIWEVWRYLIEIYIRMWYCMHILLWTLSTFVVFYMLIRNGGNKYIYKIQWQRAYSNDIYCHIQGYNIQ